MGVYDRTAARATQVRYVTRTTSIHSEEDFDTCKLHLVQRGECFLGIS